MTEKRFFLLEYKNNLIYDSEKDTEYSVQFKKQKQNLCDLLNKQEERIQELEQEKESWKSSACHDLNLKSMLAFEIGKLTETKDIGAFLDFYYKYFCNIGGEVRMGENKRFIVKTDDGLVISIKDNMTKKYIFTFACENIDDYENIFDELVNITVQLNNLWGQVLRFESYSRCKLNDLAMIDKIITKTDLDNHKDCVSAIKRIDELTNGYGD